MNLRNDYETVKDLSKTFVRIRVHGGTMQEEFIPLPSEIPRSPNLDEVPHYIKISKTVESLIGQNEDLMARLKVNIRQNTLLESQLQDQIQTTREMRNLNSKMSSQLEISIEKESLLREKLDSQDLELETIRETLNHSNVTMHQVSILKSYQRRVRLWVRAYISKMNYQIKLLTQKNKELENDVIEQQKKANGFKIKMNDAVYALQIKEREHQKNKIQLIEDFETQTYKMNKENQNYAIETKSLKQKLQTFNETQKQLTQAQGQAISFERKYEDLKTQSEIQLTELNKNLHQFMTQAEIVKLQNEGLAKRNTELESQNRTLTVRNHEAMSRHEAMNVLWSETQLQRAQLKLKNEAIIKLNHDLSLKLKEQKKMMTGADILTKQERHSQVQNICEIESLMEELETAVQQEAAIEKNI